MHGICNSTQAKTKLIQCKTEAETALDIICPNTNPTQRLPVNELLTIQRHIRMESDPAVSRSHGRHLSNDNIPEYRRLK